jgi:GNAT superfamily N-acetyltransferase
MQQLIAHPVTEPHQVERMRQIYNDTIDDLATTPLVKLNEYEQQDWWREREVGTRAWLYAPIVTPWRMVAFCLLTQRNGFVTPLFAIDPMWHGRGYGKEIIQHYLTEAKGPLAGSALKKNAAIMHLNQQAGWQVLSETEEVVNLYHPGREECFDSIVAYHDRRA